jgi:predicted metalloprotease
MRWSTGRRSGNVEDRRSLGGRGLVGGGLGAVVLALVVWLAGGDPTALLGTGGETRASTPEEDRLADFASVVLADTEDVWRAQFAKMGRTYREPKLVLYRGQVDSGCGFASAAVGPFYCPADATIYLDLSFFEELHRRFGAPGDFAQAYVIAHEVGHHVQHLLGIAERVQGRRGTPEANRASVRLELQADFLAGFWAHHAQRARAVLEPGDLEEALRAASAIGDDTIQKRSQGRVVPDSFTHGTSAQRVAWFRRGFETGDFAQGDTFDDRVFEQGSAR